MEIFQHSDRDYKQVITFLETTIGEWDDEEYQPLWRDDVDITGQLYEKLRCL